MTPKSIFVFFAIFLSIIFIIGYKNNPRCQIDINNKLSPELQDSFKHNYVVFSSKDYKQQTRLVEVNGWLLLEGVIRKSLEMPVSAELNNTIKSFDANGFAGWWPEDLMQSGKGHLLVYYDADDTAWLHRYNGFFINESVLKVFLSDESLPKPFDYVCIDINCHREYVLRTWGNPNWRAEDDDINIIVIANFITMLDNNSALSKIVFDTNKQLINSLIENHEVTDYFEYFEPKGTGYFLLLFYDEKGPKFLSDKSRNILLKKLKDSFHELSEFPIHSIVAENTNNCIVIFYNDNIPKLIQYYAKQNWGIG